LREIGNEARFSISAIFGIFGNLFWTVLCAPSRPLRLKALLFNFHFLAISAILAIWSSVFRSLP
jgi:hypothetical protein